MTDTNPSGEPPAASEFSVRRLWRANISRQFSYDILLVTGGRIATIAAQMMFVKLYAQVFSAAELGQYFFWQTISYSMNALIFVPLDQFQQVNIHRYRREGTSLLSFAPLNLMPIVAVLLLGILTSSIGSARIGSVWIAPFYAAIFAISVHLSNALRSASNNLGHRRMAVLFGFLDALLRLAFLFVATRLFQLQSIAILLTSSFAGLAVAIGILPFFRSRRMWGSDRIVPLNIHEFGRFVWPIIAAAVLNWLQVQNSRFLVPLGYAEVIGIFATVSAIGAAGMQAASGIFQMMFLPDLYRSFGGTIRKYILMAGATVAVVMIVSSLIASPLVGILTTSSFKPYAYCILFGIAIEGGNLLVGGLNIYMQVHRKTVLGLIPAAAGFIGAVAPLLVLYAAHAITPLTLGLCATFSQALTVLIGIEICRRISDQNDPGITTAKSD